MYLIYCSNIIESFKSDLVSDEVEREKNKTT